MKISIILDIEGVSGAVWGAYGLPESGELPFNTEMMTAELNTVVRTLHEEGVDDVVVYEAHKVQPGVLPSYADVTRRPGYLEGADALFFVGQHGPANDRRAVLAHTRSSKTIHRMTLNGMPCGELTFSAAEAGAMGIPTVFASGERRTQREAERNLPPLQFVCDEVGLSNHSALCRPFSSIENELRVKTRNALKNIPRTKPFNIGRTVVKIEYQYPGMAEKIAQFSFARRQGNAVVIEAKDAREAARLFMAQVVGRDFWCTA